jgi:hypothetical protein
VPYRHLRAIEALAHKRVGWILSGELDTLHALRHLRRAERLGDHDGLRVRLLPRGAAGAPDAHLLARPLALDDLRQDVGREEVPGAVVAEEARDVDEDRVEEAREFVRVDSS